MRCVIVCVSVSHGNTRLVAGAAASELGAEVLEPEQLDPEAVAGYDLVGFASGVYDFQVHPRLRSWVERLPRVAGTPAFILCTSGFGILIERPWPAPLARLLRGRGFTVIGSFCCRGYDTSPAARLLGGINRGRPDQRDLRAARAFARRVAKAARALHP